MKKLDKPDRTRYMLMAILAIAVTIIGLYVYWQFVPITIYYDMEQPYLVMNENKEVRMGESVEVKQKYCKKGDKFADITAFLMNESESFCITLYHMGSARSEGCYDNTVGTAIIPDGIKPGEYKIKYVIHVNINAVRDETVILETELFKVVE